MVYKTLSKRVTNKIIRYIFYLHHQTICWYVTLPLARVLQARQALNLKQPKLKIFRSPKQE